MVGTRRIRRALGAGAVLVSAAVGVQVIGAGQAQASELSQTRTTAATGSATCGSDGTYSITWTVTNTRQSAEAVTVISHDPAVGSVSPSTPVQLAQGAVGHFVQTGVPGASRGAGITLSAAISDEPEATDTGSVTLDGDCAPTHVAVAPTATAASCAYGDFISGAVTVPSDAGVQYTLDGTPRRAGSYRVTSGRHRVVASSTSYTLSGQTVFDLNVAAPTTSCKETVTPVAPTIVQASCAAGATVPGLPTVNLASTNGITYSVSRPGPYEQGQTVLVTATAESGHAFGATAPTGWSRVDATHETFAVSFDAVTCAPVVRPGVPVATDSVCTGSGAPSAPTLALPTTAGIGYTVSPSGAYTAGQQVTVTAHALAPNRFVEPAADGWTYVDPVTETYVVAFRPAPHCVSPTAPTLRQASCDVGGYETAPNLSLPVTAGVVYSVSAPSPYVAGQQVVVTATATNGDQFTPTAPAGWVYLNPTHETFIVMFFAAPHCTQAAAPSFSDDRCSGNRPVGATYTIPSAAGVEYRIGGSVVPPGTYPASDGTSVTVTAAARPGYTLTGTTLFTHVFGPAPDCRTAVVAVPPTFSDSSCPATSAQATAAHPSLVGGAAATAAATYTIANSAGVDYLIDGKAVPAGTYPAKDGTTVVVTARARDGYVLSGVSVFTHTFAAPRCLTPVSAVSPSFVDQQCANGQVPRGASYTVPATQGVVYLVAGSPVPAGSYAAVSGTSVTVSARAADGFVLTGPATFTHAFPLDPSCTGAVQVRAPGFDATRCADSTPVPAAYTIPSGPGVDYFVRFVPSGTPVGTGPPVLTAPGTYVIDRPGTITVTAQPQTGYTLQGRTTFTYQVATTTCVGALTPASVSFQDPVCVGTSGTSGSAYVIPTSVGAAYYVAGKRVSAGVHVALNGSTVTVVARPAAGFTLTGVSEWTHRFPVRASCPGSGTLPLTSPVTSLGSGGTLGPTGSPAATGAPVSLLLTGGIVLLLAGAGLLLLAGRRRPDPVD